MSEKNSCCGGKDTHHGHSPCERCKVSGGCRREVTPSKTTLTPRGKVVDAVRQWLKALGFKTH